MVVLVADALFGKRSEGSDSHDRYANIEVAYLLQRMEAYPGAVILATNFRRNIDDAFVRRLDFVIDFPFPEADDRRRLWELLLPSEAPLADDIDLDFLAERFKLSGGAIRNCSLAAAFQAADDDAEIGMPHLVRAVAQEYAKQGRLTLEADFARFHEFVRVPDEHIGYLAGGWFTMGMLLSLPMILFGLFLMIIAYRRGVPTGNLALSQ